VSEPAGSHIARAYPAGPDDAAARPTHRHLEATFRRCGLPPRERMRDAYDFRCND
jgi:hypothetical protein